MRPAARRSMRARCPREQEGTSTLSLMRLGRSIALLACAAALPLRASASAAHSVGSAEQIAWVRRAATNFVSAELAGNGAGACGILNAPLRAHRASPYAARSAGTQARAACSHEPGGRARLRAQQRAIPSAVVLVHGDVATIELPDAAARRGRTASCGPKTAGCSRAERPPANTAGGGRLR